MAFRILADDAIAVTPELTAIAETLRRVPGSTIQRDDLQSADVLLVRSITQVTEQLLTGSQITHVGSATAGFDHVDRDYLQQRGIGFSCAPGANANAVVEYVLSVLAARQRLGHVLEGGGIGVLGYGHVGRHLAALVTGLGGAVRCWDPWQQVPESIRGESLQHVLSQPVLSLHASLHNEAPWPSCGIIDRESAQACFQGQLVINAARGPLITAEAIDILDEKGVEMVLDVWPEEPRITTQQFAKVALGTPHIAGYSLTAKQTATNMLVASITGKPPATCTQQGAAIDMRGCDTDSASDWLTRLLLANYDPGRDHRLLAACVADTMAPETFEALRTDYPLRRELRGLPVEVDGELPERLQRLCKVLGARPEYTGGG